MALGDRGHPLPDDTPDLAPHVRVDLVEHEDRHGVQVGEDRLQRQHHPRELAARGDPAEGQRRLSHVGGEQELAAAVPRRAEARRVCDRDPELGLCEPELRDAGSGGARQVPRRLLADRAKGGRGLPRLAGRGLDLSVEPRKRPLNVPLR